MFIIIPVFNRWLLTEACLLSLQNQTYKHFKIVVIDHGSSDNTSDNIKNKFPQVIVLKGNESMWWTAATNLGIKYALQHDASHILTLNNDLIIADNYLDLLIDQSEKMPKCIIGSVSVDIKNKDRLVFAGTIWNKLLAKYSSPVPLNLSYYEFSNKYNLIECDLLPGRGTLIPSSIFNVIGLYNEESFPHYMADEDFSDRAKANGFRLYVNSKSIVYSHINATGLNDITSTKSKLLAFRQILTSTKSPNNIFTRWNWSKKSKFPIPYFVLDFGRVFLSQLLKLLK